MLLRQGTVYMEQQQKVEGGACVQREASGSRVLQGWGRDLWAEISHPWGPTPEGRVLTI